MSLNGYIRKPYKENWTYGFIVIHLQLRIDFGVNGVILSFKINRRNILRPQDLVYTFHRKDLSETSLRNLCFIQKNILKTKNHHYFSISFIQQLYEDPRIENVRKFSYGIVLPIVCALGIIGNVLNLVVLTRRNMRGTAYIYMRGKLK